jgi:site-specific DNA-adenine methylase
MKTRTQTQVKVPQFGYPGSKAKLAKQIIELLPPSGDRYFEVFAGRANLFFRVAQQLD